MDKALKDFLKFKESHAAVVPERISREAVDLHDFIVAGELNKVNVQLCKHGVELLCEVNRFGKNAWDYAMARDDLKMVNLIKKHMRLHKEGKLYA